MALTRIASGRLRRCRPRRCQQPIDKADWIFSTYYNVLGDCDHTHSAKVCRAPPSCRAHPRAPTAWPAAARKAHVLRRPSRSPSRLAHAQVSASKLVNETELLKLSTGVKPPNPLCTTGFGRRVAAAAVAPSESESSAAPASSAPTASRSRLNGRWTGLIFALALVGCIAAAAVYWAIVSDDPLPEGEPAKSTEQLAED
jgi:hypothetical protein